jgi:hypothetical protein
MSDDKKWTVGHYASHPDNPTPPAEPQEPLTSASEILKRRYGVTEERLEQARKELAQEPPAREWRAGEIAHDVEFGIDGPNWFVEKREYDKLQAELRELKQSYAYVTGRATEYGIELNAMRAECARLRKALERAKGYMGTCDYCVDALAEIERLERGADE